MKIYKAYCLPAIERILTNLFLFLMIFTATSEFVLWSKAFTTWPNDPFPMTSRTSYLYMRWSCKTYNKRNMGNEKRSTVEECVAYVDHSTHSFFALHKIWVKLSMVGDAIQLFHSDMGEFLLRFTSIFQFCLVLDHNQQLKSLHGGEFSKYVTVPQHLQLTLR